MKMLLFLLVSSGLVIANAHVLKSEEPKLVRNKRLIGSTNTTIHNHPYHVAIEEFGSYDCSGIIIGPNIILTAAHCLDNENRAYQIRAGTSRLRRGGSKHKLIYKAVHENFTYNERMNSRNDIAIAFVSPAFKLDDTRSFIAMNERVLGKDEELHEIATVTGWGEVYSDGPNAEVLQALGLPLHSKSFCNDNYAPFGGIYEGQMCAGYVGVRNKDVCAGDSGGGLVLRDQVIGIFIYLEGNCGQLDHPPVFTEVAFYKPWITKQIELYRYISKFVHPS